MTWYNGLSYVPSGNPPIRSPLDLGDWRHPFYVPLAGDSPPID